MTDDELRSMLREWEAPGAPASLVCWLRIDDGSGGELGL